MITLKKGKINKMKGDLTIFTSYMTYLFFAIRTKID